LLAVRPYQAPCFDDPDSTECQELLDHNFDAWYRSDQPGNMMIPLNACNRDTFECCRYEEGSDNICHQGAISAYAVDATTAEHVQNAVRFAAEHNIRLTVKATGHDF